MAGGPERDKEGICLPGGHEVAWQGSESPEGRGRQMADLRHRY